MQERVPTLKGKNAVMEARWQKFQLFVQIPLSGQKAAKSCALYFCDQILLMCKALSQRLPPFWLSILSHVLQVNCLIINNWIYIPSRPENTNWVVSWRKVFELSKSFSNSHFEELYTKKMRRTFLGDSHHWAPLANALCYRIIKLNKNIKRTNLDKTNKTHIYVYIFTLFIRGTILRSRPMDVWHIPHKCRKR